MKSIIIFLLLLIWFACSLLLVVSIIGILLLWESDWTDIPRQLIDKL